MVQRLLCVKIVLAYSIKNTGPAILNAIETVAGIVGISIMDHAAAFTAAPGAAVAGQGDNSRVRGGADMDGLGCSYACKT